MTTELALTPITDLPALLQRETGQDFSPVGFLWYCRYHGIACESNHRAGADVDQFTPRKKYIGSWFVAKKHPDGEIEWLVKPVAVEELAQLIAFDCRVIASTMKSLTAGGAQ